MSKQQEIRECEEAILKAACSAEDSNKRYWRLSTHGTVGQNDSINAALRAEIELSLLKAKAYTDTVELFAAVAEYQDIIEKYGRLTLFKDRGCDGCWENSNYLEDECIYSHRHTCPSHPDYDDNKADIIQEATEPLLARIAELEVRCGEREGGKCVADII